MSKGALRYLTFIFKIHLEPISFFAIKIISLIKTHFLLKTRLHNYE